MKTIGYILASSEEEATTGLNTIGYSLEKAKSTLAYMRKNYNRFNRYDSYSIYEVCIEVKKIDS